MSELDRNAQILLYHVEDLMEICPNQYVLITSDGEHMSYSPDLAMLSHQAELIGMPYVLCLISREGINNFFAAFGFHVEITGD
ncbi:MAG TPA: hypothetical protein VLH19_01650 [Patescibacteria group bacterium]|nr:hypothetical protein [Patescibacteria group bacterium]